MRSSSDIEQAIRTYGTTVWRACAVYFKSPADAEDAYQETFLRYALADDQGFSSEEHRKAWLIRVATNICKDMLKASSQKNLSFEANDTLPEPLSEDPASQPSSFASDVMDVLRDMDDPPRTPLYLTICEEYSAPEIADLMDVPVNTVYTWISRGKQTLREALS